MQEEDRKKMRGIGVSAPGYQKERVKGKMRNVALLEKVCD